MTSSTLALATVANTVGRIGVSEETACFFALVFVCAVPMALWRMVLSVRNEEQ